jgi:N-ethylmaleimide reductase
MTTIFDPLKIGDLTLQNRFVMAPLTRMRSKQPGNIPTELNAKYYAQRASAGLIISEATQVSQQGQGYPATPGIHSAEQIAGWKLVTDAVRKEGGKIFLQLWHVGRISHRSHQPNNDLPVAPSAIKPSGGTFSSTWKQVAFETPRALETAEIATIIEQFKQGAKNAKEAGFDGVEVHGANGYLLDQFLQDGSNKRTDNYGGSIENRARLLLEVVDSAIAIWGEARVGVRLSPYGTFNDMQDSDPVALFSYVLKELENRKIGYVHLIEPRATSAGGDDKINQEAIDTSKLFRKSFSGVLISAGGYNPQNAQEAIELGVADAVAFGRIYIANPDLVKRVKEGKELNKYDRATFYGGGEKGYTDYPTLA